jgi:hypothetical protein
VICPLARKISAVIASVISCEHRVRGYFFHSIRSPSLRSYAEAVLLRAVLEFEIVYKHRPASLFIY